MPGTITFSSTKFRTFSSPVLGSLIINLPKAFEVSDLIIQFFKKTSPPIKTSSLAGIKDFHF